jgi:Family of unknown function (DUF6328)
MSKELDRKVKTALDETRLLILGVQVLLGFEFQSFFQDGFDQLSPVSKLLSVTGLGLVILSTALLVIPSMQHRLVEQGQSTVRLIRAASFYAGLALAPLAASLGLAAYVVIGRHFGLTVGVASAVILAGLAVFGWFGFELLIGLETGGKRMAESETPLATKIEQLLTEARVIIPGAQALFGFQFIAMLTSGFDRLPQSAKIIHAVALCLIAINVVLLMTPAALHRLSFGGEDTPSFLKMGSALVIAAPIFLAGGIAAELYVVVQKVFGDGGWIGSLAGFLLLMLLWYSWPLALRRRGAGGGG